MRPRHVTRKAIKLAAILRRSGDGLMAAFGAIGWYDDWLKIVKRDPNGMKSRWKYLLQSLLGLGAGLFLYYTADVPAATTFYIPFFKAVALPLVSVSFVLVAALKRLDIRRRGVGASDYDLPMPALSSRS